MAALALAACVTGIRCPGPDLGGWMVDERYGHHQCTEHAERFELREVGKRRPDGGVAEWGHLAALEVPLRRGESTMFGFECGSRQGRRGDAIAVVRSRRDGSFAVLRAWVIDTEHRQLVAVPPETVACESLE